MSQSSNGYGLWETMLVLAVIAILAALSLPNFQGWRQEQAERQTLQDLEVALHFARLAALSRHEAILLAPDPSWSQGAKVVDEEGRTLRRWRFASAKLKIQFQGLRGDAQLMFSASGGAEGYNGRFFLDGVSGHWQIVVSSSGRSRLN